MVNVIFIIKINKFKAPLFLSFQKSVSVIAFICSLICLQCAFIVLLLLDPKTINFVLKLVADLEEEELGESRMGMYIYFIFIMEYVNWVI